MPRPSALVLLQTKTTRGSSWRPVRTTFLGTGVLSASAGVIADAAVVPTPNKERAHDEGSRTFLLFNDRGPSSRLCRRVCLAAARRRDYALLPQPSKPLRSAHTKSIPSMTSRPRQDRRAGLTTRTPYPRTFSQQAEIRQCHKYASIYLTPDVTALACRPAGEHQPERLTAAPGGCIRRTFSEVTWDRIAGLAVRDRLTR